MSSNTGAASLPTYTVGSKRDLYVTVRDGARIATDVYRPFADGRFPALLAAGPYGKDFVHLPAMPSFAFRETGPINWYVERGYAYIHMDARGTGKSEGRFGAFDPASQNDLYDVIEWIADQPWCNGKVGMIGAGFYGVNQWLAACVRPPHLMCIAPCDALVDTYRDFAYHGGVPSACPESWHHDIRARRLLDYPERRWPSRTPLTDGLARKLSEASSGSIEQVGLRALVRASNLLERIRPSPMNADILYGFLDNALDGPFYWTHGAASRLSAIEVPVYSVGTWDSLGLHLRGNLLAYESIDVPRKLMVTGDVGLSTSWPLLDGPEPPGHFQHLYATVAFHEELLRWYDFWLKDLPTAVMDDPPVSYWVQGAGVWRTSTSWPPPEVTWCKLYLQPGPDAPRHSLNDGGLSFDPPPSEAEPALIRYPDPCWTGPNALGSAVLGHSGAPDRVKAILTFTSDPLTDSLDIAGPIRLLLHASSSETDTDFIVRLADVPVRGARDQATLDALGLPPQARTVSRGWLRASHRAVDEARSTQGRPWHPHDAPEQLEPGVVYLFDIEIWPVAWHFERGHCVRLEVAPADSPYFDGPSWHLPSTSQGQNRIYHEARYPSHVLLPLMPSTSAGPARTDDGGACSDRFASSREDTLHSGGSTPVEVDS